MSNIGVIGAGIMGSGVAHALAKAGYKVILIDISEDILNLSKERISNTERFQGFMKNSNSDIDRIIDNIQFATNYEVIENAEYIIENASEVWDIKKEIYQKLDSICQDATFLANTSCISVTQLASLMSDPSKVIGVHFMNPVSFKRAVEVIKGYHTSEETILKTKKLLDRLDKEAILVNDYPGFVSNRVSHLFMNEAAFIVQDQVASPKEVDDIFKKCYGHKMGPLETADLIGLDTVVNSLDILVESYQDPKFRCCPLLRKMVYAGQLGRKSGKGFYDYYTDTLITV
ncbi:3-hydroxybutyryl-CoA dehydrogenase [Bacillus pseudomycoides]|uniref:3-hydroxyacyl-CoA dehydrogenase family protein n=1 Tax=Bacillus TaxID=1386 RepID=UPI000372BDC3|nr:MULTISPECIES: 3-hydroxyacyl-CoA dehydrogenase family protein [Bacillus]PDX99225.1 3-hydroxybutyryl-CoA dehydrogenase [Bacillus pseudomycoides]PEK80739.1 3-hydroxybutyryl-CoA dehydrogenase [Bacillus pseudomycoides]PEN08117.1 3-hydroxybutyryl-CoA dehydrogenase [Bacillus pseudomycoides]PGB87540.1 3-hydroxybutyryl-CoA dehydrogenase [Bacillus pseudomycoides]PGS04532.1 3-hydroxybutyryl-CoA dehydrogenase [Bacillus pseudomycoides]